MSFFNNKYIINENGVPILEPDLHTWATWFETAERHVAQQYIGGVYVSTVFLGIDHNFGFGGPPILYKTMIFGGKHDEYQMRSATKHAALSNHDEAVAMVRDSQRSWLRRFWNWMRSNGH